MKFHLYKDFLKNMGLRYVVFRVLFLIKTKLGVLKLIFPTSPKSKEFMSLKTWRQEAPDFFFKNREDIQLPRDKSIVLRKAYEDIKNNKYTFFSRNQFKLNANDDWITNPDNDYKYDINSHFTNIKDLSQEAGDIKYVWEKARFSFLYDILSYDYHFEDDQSQFVFDQIEDFIDKNPINQGPNYKCSQEISLRILNWTFALYFYKDSDRLTDELFKKIVNSIYWQLHHVYHNINFSRIAVRNNHAITETMMLYLSNLLFPFIPETVKWSKKGKKWFEQEIAYQIYEDGTYLQYSMNYHRVVVQLLTWAIRLSEIHNVSLEDVVYNKARKSLEFLDTCLNRENGHLPNYGSNDGALFFKLTTNDYRNYKSQLDDLRAILFGKTFYNTSSHYWYGIKNISSESYEQEEVSSFEKGGYYIINDANSKTFIRCGSYKDRPAQSDNLHLDIWVNGVNYLRDSGTYKYNTSQELTNYFMGCEGHNTISIEGHNQMLKGGRFIWFNWVKQSKASLEKVKNTFFFSGEITAFKTVGSNIKHTRNLTKEQGKLIWKVIDTVSNIKGKEIIQYWHLNPNYLSNIIIEAKDIDNNILDPILEDKWYSGYYGEKEKSIRLSFKTKSNKLTATIRIQH